MTATIAPRAEALTRSRPSHQAARAETLAATATVAPLAETLAATRLSRRSQKHSP